ncbi:DNA cytosine methyltransferase [bacterium]|nr:DNA cytosine methyltransferase [candidate division CSSED10-310 bacterium]
MRAIEFFSGIGGFRLALGNRHQVVAAYDISQPANITYEHTFTMRPQAREIATLSPAELHRHHGELWVMSPPCQPFCALGRKRDMEDRRNAALLHLITLLDDMEPPALCMENVAGFMRSRTREHLLEQLSRHRYHFHEWILDPIQFGIPNRRPRYFLAATHAELHLQPLKPIPPVTLNQFLEPDPAMPLYLSEAQIRTHGPGFNVVTAEDRSTNCFIGGYGRLLVRGGSYLRTDRGLRRFSPLEIARLHGFPEWFRFPAGVSMRQQYRLVGNSMNLLVAAWITGHLTS